MEIIVTDYPSSGILQGLKWHIVERGFQYLSSEQLDKNKVKMTFKKAPEMTPFQR